MVLFGLPLTAAPKTAKGRRGALFARSARGYTSARKRKTGGIDRPECAPVRTVFGRVWGTFRPPRRTRIAEGGAEGGGAVGEGRVEGGAGRRGGRGGWGGWVRRGGGGTCGIIFNSFPRDIFFVLTSF